MALPLLDGRRRLGTRAIWVAGALALLGMVTFSWLTATPYPTTWPWITFAAMAILEETLIGPATSDASPGPRIVLIAAIIMFRKHPDVTAIVTVAAGVVGGFLTRTPWRAVLTRTASLMVIAMVATAALRIVGYGDTAHFVVATGVLILIYLMGVATLTALRPSVLSWPVAGLLGALLALAWRTPASGPLMLRMGEIAILGLIGIVIGFARGGDPRGLVHQRMHLRKLPLLAIVGGAGLVLSTRLGSLPAAVTAATSLAAIALFAIRLRWFPIVCMLLGGMANEIARVANSGRMPVATGDLPVGIVDDLGSLSQAPTYQSVDGATHLAWLADRFPLSPFPGIASPGDLFIAVGIIWLFASLTLRSRSRLAVDASVPAAAA